MESDHQESRAADHFASELSSLVERMRHEYTLTYSEAIGVLELVKADIIEEARSSEKDKGHEEPPEVVSRAGWRHFECDVCGQEWRETCRDRFSMSGVSCECCSEWVAPRYNSGIPAVEVDEWCNVIKHEVFVTVWGCDPS